jgi:hypothetical protein
MEAAMGSNATELGKMVGLGLRRITVRLVVLIVIVVVMVRPAHPLPLTVW